MVKIASILGVFWNLHATLPQAVTYLDHDIHKIAATQSFENRIQRLSAVIIAYDTTLKDIEASEPTQKNLQTLQNIEQEITKQAKQLQLENSMTYIGFKKKIDTFIETITGKLPRK